MSQFVTEHYADQEAIFIAGELADHLYFLESGEVELVSATQQVFGTIPQGQSFGEAAILKGGIRGATIRAKGQVTCKKISNDSIIELLSSYSPLLVTIMEALLLQQAMNNQIKIS